MRSDQHEYYMAGLIHGLDGSQSHASAGVGTMSEKWHYCRGFVVGLIARSPATDEEDQVGCPG